MKFSRPAWIAGGLVILFSAGGTGCSSARMSDHESDRLFKVGQYQEAAARLKRGLASEGGDDSRDSLLYLLDIGLALHSAGQYEESNLFFLKAEKIAEIKDYTSLSAEAATLVTTDSIKQYKGEDFEKILINTYLAMNYAALGNYEDSLVEARRVNHNLQLMVTEGKRKYKQNAFARYISAILYEAEGNYNDAYVDYKNTRDLTPSLPGLGLDLWRCALHLRMPDEMERWDKEFNLSPAQHEQAIQTEKKMGRTEIIVFYENGISPVKRPNPHFHEIPKFYPRLNPVLSAQVQVNGELKGSTQILENIETTAIKNLDEKYAGLIAKKVAGLVAKGAVGYGVAKATDSPLLGYLTASLLRAADQADVRSWNLLPHDLQVFRIPVEPGTYTINVLPNGASPLSPKVVQVGPGRKVFVNFRYMP